MIIQVAFPFQLTAQTTDSCLLSLGSSLAEDVFGRSREHAGTTVLGKRAAGGVMIAMAALAMWARDVTIWGLIELKMELLIQCVPSFLVAIHWRRFRAKPAFIGLVLGTAIAVAGVFAGMKDIEGLHIGVIGLTVNAAIACGGSLLPARSGFNGRASPSSR